jgi:hypothetical protein
MMKLVGFAVSSLIGYVIGNYLLDGPAAAYASILISYHIYLVFLVFLVMREERGLAMPVGQAITTHLAFLAVLIALPYMREQVPFFGLIQLLIPGLAPFESKWLFSRAGAVKQQHVEEPEAGMHDASEDDHDAFRAYLRLEHRPFRKPGFSLNQEFNAWLADRRMKADAGTTATTAR